MNDMAKNILLWVIIAVVLMSVFNNFGPPTPRAQSVPYSEFIADVKAGRVQSVVIDGRTVKGQKTSGEAFSSYTPNDPEMINDLLSNGVQVKAQAPEQESLLMQIFISWFPMLLLIGVWIYFMNRMQGGGKGGAMGFGKSKAKMLTEKHGRVTFDDVAGIDEAKEELSEIIDFLRDPKKFTRLGGRIPKGVLLMGPPGTGKTLLGRAIAGEAGVPFFSISGSDFVEMFVGVGASRVRDMFDQAKKQAPCIIFIDELDALGLHVHERTLPVHQGVEVTAHEGDAIERDDHRLEQVKGLALHQVPVAHVVQVARRDGGCLQCRRRCCEL